MRIFKISKLIKMRNTFTGMKSKTSLNHKISFNFSIEQYSLLIFISIGLLGAFNHSLWRDEMQGWLVAWRSDDLLSLWQNNAPSGHPVLWSTLIYLVKDITGSPLSMQLLHWGLGCLALICFWRWNPLKSWQKALFTFGYYPFWEYYFVCRHYVLAELLTFIFCSAYPLRRKSYLPSALCLGLLVNTHAFAWSLAFAAFVTLFVEWISTKEQRHSYFNNKYWILDLSVSLLILIVLTTLSIYSLLQVREAVDVIPSDFDIRHLFRVIGRVFGGYVLIIPNHQRWFDLIFCSIITIGFISVTLSFLKRSISASLFFISGISFLFAFNYFLYLGIGSRHYGYYFLILIASIWLALHSDHYSQDQRIDINRHIPLVESLSKLFPHLLTFCLAIHSAAGIHRVLYDFYVPYSAGKVTAEYIQAQGWSDEQIFGTRDVEVSTVSGYLDRDIFYPELNDWGSYAQWNNRISIDRKDTLFHLNSFFSKHPDINRLLVILSKASAFREMNTGQTKVQGDLRILADKKFERSWIKPERFYLYWVEKMD